MHANQNGCRRPRWFPVCSLLLAGLLAVVGLTLNRIPGGLTVRAAEPAGVQARRPDSVSGEVPRRVQLCGTVFGVRMQSDGVMVVGLADFRSDGQKVNPAREAGMQAGDVIKRVNGRAVYTNRAFADAVKGGGSLTLYVVTAGGDTDRRTVLPRKSDADDRPHTGMWVRDSAAGIGTLTYLDPETGTFGGLGHGICDCDTQAIVPVYGGDIVEAEVTDVRRGVRGAAGELRGYLCGGTLGVIRRNTVCGAFGSYTAPLPRGREYPVALRQEVRPGRAQVLCTVESGGRPRLYDIEIEKINYNSREPARNMIVKVTDRELLAATGGIVQGMSGSPIVQNGRFAGAVTHVFVNNPACGYAVFAENMLKAAA